MKRKAKLAIVGGVLLALLLALCGIGWFVWSMVTKNPLVRAVNIFGRGLEVNEQVLEQSVALVEDTVEIITDDLRTQQMIEYRDALTSVNSQNALLTQRVDALQRQNEIASRTIDDYRDQYNAQQQQHAELSERLRNMETHNVSAASPLGDAASIQEVLRTLHEKPAETIRQSKPAPMPIWRTDGDHLRDRWERI